MRKRSIVTLTMLSAAALVLTGCAGASGGEGSGEEDSSPADLGTATILTNWFAQAEQGPYWAAQAEGLAEARGVDLTVTQGGPGIQTVPQVAAGEADFGVANADEIAVAVSNGLPIVAVMAGFDQNIQCLAYHESSGITDFGDLNGFRVAQTLIPYWDYIKQEYDLNDVQEVNLGSLAQFEADPGLVQQCFITSEPYVLEQDGIEGIGYLMVRDSGFNPYQNMLFTTQRMIDEKPDVVRAVVEASIEGWDRMLADPQQTKDLIQQVNTESDPGAVDYAIEKMRADPDLVGDSPGSQSDERWSTLKDQLVEIGLLPDDFDIASVYTTEYSNT